MQDSILKQLQVPNIDKRHCDSCKKVVYCSKECHEESMRSSHLSICKHLQDANPDIKLLLPSLFPEGRRSNMFFFCLLLCWWLVGWLVVFTSFSVAGLTLNTTLSLVCFAEPLKNLLKDLPYYDADDGETLHSREQDVVEVMTLMLANVQVDPTIWSKFLARTHYMWKSPERHLIQDEEMQLRALHNLFPKLKSSIFLIWLIAC